MREYWNPIYEFPDVKIQRRKQIKPPVRQDVPDDQLGLLVDRYKVIAAKNRHEVNKHRSATLH